MIIIKDIQYITDIEKLKIISDPLRISILTTFGTEKKNSRELAKLLKINRTKIHYHLNILEENNFIEVVDTDSINGIIQKYYLPTAQAFVPSPSIFNDLFNNTSVNFNVKKEDVKDFWDEVKKLEKKFSSKDNDGVSISIISTAR
ncbi:MAG: helix-turn-helix domain-containing protein [Gemella haemolysans]|uniref:ArsR/SmtB family transcription factor n=1 Tax=Gemella haemolysans TaxID=1379 RepID=UPI0029065864|nr:helix-turn-helix domain-containing protein [Gemella haemolysans]MDU6573655.1 helix-turn-helix domain-containing protein [Gemella haemolysans]